MIGLDIDWITYVSKLLKERSQDYFPGCANLN
jgi:hypothetical protein